MTDDELAALASLSDDELAPPPPSDVVFGEKVEQLTNEFKQDDDRINKQIQVDIKKENQIGDVQEDERLRGFQEILAARCHYSRLRRRSLFSSFFLSKKPFFSPQLFLSSPTSVNKTGMTLWEND